MLSTVRTYASFVKFSHTVFALPFAIAGMVAAYAVPIRFETSLGQTNLADAGVWYARLPFSWATLGLILCCMVGARSFAMAMNRILDRRIDAANPRTAQREIPAGKLKLSHAWIFALASAALYFGSCVMLGEVVLALSPIPILLMVIYPWTKRFTSLCHVALGVSLGLAPVGAWVAVRTAGISFGYSPWRQRIFPLHEVQGWESLAVVSPWLLGAAVMLWVAGFDIIYALQDDEFDREHKLHSIPAALGRIRALWVSRTMHALAVSLFFGFVCSVALTILAPVLFISNGNLHSVVWAAPCVMLVGMVYQHSLVKPNDLSRVNVAFFTVNGIISVIFGAIFVAAWLLA